ncbi:TauD/TfdA family dioxygenase [Streptomyces sp. enrichment culture]|uniref:TauD/TfdA family dioxygenase n=1 Tax=Streptomyces sp. enrichment culture TaxID=1795815 RepID=UPI003F54D187
MPDGGRSFGEHTPHSAAVLRRLRPEDDPRTGRGHACTVRHRREPGDIAVWDNRAVAHLRPADLHHTDHRRRLYRVPVLGDRPVSDRTVSGPGPSPYAAHRSGPSPTRGTRLRQPCRPDAGQPGAGGGHTGRAMPVSGPAEDDRRAVT